MPVNNRQFILQLMDETRSKTEAVLPQINPSRFIYPGWSIHALLAHITGWDNAVIDALHARLNNQPPKFTGIRSLDEYNSLSVASRQDLDHEQTIDDWRITRQELRTIIEQIPEGQLETKVVVPWGGESTPIKLMLMLCEHEEEHLRDIAEWLNDSTNQR